jgi:hypothetical protein
MAHSTLDIIQLNLALIIWNNFLDQHCVLFSKLGETRLLYLLHNFLILFGGMLHLSRANLPSFIVLY